MTEAGRLEEEIARAIADSLRLEIGAGDRPILTGRAAVDPEAYDAYLRGRHVWLRATPLRARGARENADSIRLYANRALSRDSSFAGGYFLLAAYASVSAIRGWGPFVPLIDSAQRLARRAIALDPRFADPYAVLGVVHYLVTDDWAAGRAVLDTAVRLNPDLAFANYFLALHQGEIAGALDSAIARLQHAIAIDPQSFYFNSLGDLWMRAGRYDSAVVALRQAIALEPRQPGPHTRLIRSLEELGRFGEAIDARAAAPDSTGVGRFRAAFGRAGEPGYREVLVADLERRIDSLRRAPESRGPVPADTVPPLREHRIAWLYAQLGRWTEAMDWVLREYRRRPTRFRTVVMDPAFAGLARDPRFRELKRREGFL
jgi:tetratricopeptide (TPR) repeat protein